MKKRLICLALIVVLSVSLLAMPASASAAENEQEIYGYLTDLLGLNTASACGILANIKAESGFDPQMSHYSYYGLFSYSASRAGSMKSWCSDNGYDYSTIDGQMRYFKYEMESQYKSLLAELKAMENTADGAYEAADRFCKVFERPANPSSSGAKRGNAAADTYFPKYAGTSAPSYEETAVSYSAYTTASILNVRSGPSTRYGITKTLTRGTAVDVVAESAISDAVWCKLPSGGWISKNYLSTTAPTPSESESYSAVVTASLLNVRSAAGTDNDIVATLNYGASVTVTSETDVSGTAWCQLSSGGYICKNYIKTGTATTGTVKADVLNVRSGAGITYDVTTTLRNGATVTIMTTASGSDLTWGQLPSGGWVCMDYIA